MGHRAEKTKRVKLSCLEIDTVPESRYRYLDAREVARLNHAVNYALEHKRPLAVGPEVRRARRGRPGSRKITTQ